MAFVKYEKDTDPGCDTAIDEAGPEGSSVAPYSKLKASEENKYGETLERGLGNNLPASKLLNKKWILQRAPDTQIDPHTDFRLEQDILDLDDVSPDEVVVSMEAITVDSFVESMISSDITRVGGPVKAMGYGKVIKDNDDFAKGSIVVGLCEAARYAVVKSDDLQTKVAFASPSASMSVIGLNGIAAYIGIFVSPSRCPQMEDTVVVSAAAGSVGCIAAQMAKLCNARVIGIAGGRKKKKFLLEGLKLDGAIDYKDETKTVDEQLREECPNGIDFFFDNVGGDILDAVLRHINKKSRIVICGAVSQESNKGASEPTCRYLNLAKTSSSMTGFNTLDYPEYSSEAIRYLSWHYLRGDIVCPIHTKNGIESFAEAFQKLSEGGVYGRMIVDLAGIIKCTVNFEEDSADDDVLSRLEVSNRSAPGNHIKQQLLNKEERIMSSQKMLSRQERDLVPKSAATTNSEESSSLYIDKRKLSRQNGGKSDLGYISTREGDGLGYDMAEPKIVNPPKENSSNSEPSSESFDSTKSTDSAYEALKLQVEATRLMKEGKLKELNKHKERSIKDRNAFGHIKEERPSEMVFEKDERRSNLANDLHSNDKEKGDVQQDQPRGQYFNISKNNYEPRNESADIEYDEDGIYNVANNAEGCETFDIDTDQTSAHEQRDKDNAREQFNEAFPLVSGAKITVDVDHDGIIHHNTQDNIESGQLDLQLLNLKDDDSIHSQEPLSVAFDNSTAMNEFTSNTKHNKDLNKIKAGREDSQITQSGISSDTTEDESVPSSFDEDIILESKYKINIHHDAIRVLTVQSEHNLFQEEEYQNEDNPPSQSHELSPLVLGIKVDQEDQQIVQEPLSQNVNITSKMSKNEAISSLFNKERVMANIYDEDTKNDEALGLNSQENDCQNEKNETKQSNEISNTQLSDKGIAIGVVDHDGSHRPNIQGHIETDQLNLHVLNTEGNARFDEIKSRREDSQSTQEAHPLNNDVKSDGTEDESVSSAEILSSTYVREIVLESKYDKVTNHDASRVPSLQSELDLSSVNEYQNENNTIEHLDKNLLRGFGKDPVQNGSQVVDMNLKGGKNYVVNIQEFQQEEHNGEDDLLAGKYLDVSSPIVHNEESIMNEEELLDIYMNIHSNHENMKDVLDQDLQDLSDTNGRPSGSSIVLARETAVMDAVATEKHNQANAEESREGESQKDKRRSEQLCDLPDLALGEDMTVTATGEEDGDHRDSEKEETQSNARSSEVEPLKEEDGPNVRDLQDLSDTNGRPSGSSIVLAKETAVMDAVATEKHNQANAEESREGESQKDKRRSEQLCNLPDLALGEDMTVTATGEEDGDHRDSEKEETQSNARSSEVEPLKEDDGPSDSANESSFPLEYVTGTIVDDGYDVLQTEEELRKLLLRGDSDRVLGALNEEEDEKAKVTLVSGFRTAAIWANTQLDEESNEQTERDEMTLKKIYLATRLSEEQTGHSLSSRD